MRALHIARHMWRVFLCLSKDCPTTHKKEGKGNINGDLGSFFARYALAILRNFSLRKRAVVGIIFVSKK